MEDILQRNSSHLLLKEEPDFSTNTIPSPPSLRMNQNSADSVIQDDPQPPLDISGFPPSNDNLVDFSVGFNMPAPIKFGLKQIRGFRTTGIVVPGTNTNSFSGTETYFSACRFHILRLFLAFIHLIFGVFLRWSSSAQTMVELSHQLMFEVFHNCVPGAKESYFARVYRIIRETPTIMRSLTYQYLTNSTPISTTEITSAIPIAHYIPDHLAIILATQKQVVSAPPSLPQPYLTADKLIQVPEKKEVAKILAMRTEYFSSQVTHTAAEKVRLLSELARMATWCYLAGIKELSVFEATGWLRADLEQVGNSIIAEYYSLTGGMADIPQIKLLDCLTEYEISVSSFDTLSAGIEYPSLILNDEGAANDALFFDPSRTLSVYLLSEKNGTHEITKLAKTLLVIPERIEQEVDQKLSRWPIADLIIKPTPEREPSTRFSQYPLLTKTQKEPLLYGRNERFSFGFFIRSLFYYAEIMEQEEIRE